MAFSSIDGFRNTVRGIQRASLFNVEVVFTNASGFNTSNFQFTCKSASIPSSTFGLIEVPFMGRKVKFNGDRQYQDWTTTVIIDNDWKSYKNIYNWHAAMNDPQSNIAVSKEMPYFKGQAVVTAFAQDGTTNFKMKLDGFFPYDLQQIDMGWENTDQTTDLTVVWAYDYSLMLS